MKKQFDGWRFDFPKKGEHPVVIISHDDFCAGAVVSWPASRKSRPGWRIKSKKRFDPVEG
jgi:hypothetical protein